MIEIITRICYILEQNAIYRTFILIIIPRSSAAVGTNRVTTSNLKYILTYMTKLKHACYCVYKIRYHVVFCIKTKLQSVGTSCPAALLRLGVPSQRLT
jgi:hypothetical protein